MLPNCVRRSSINRQQVFFLIFLGLYLAWLVWGGQQPRQEMQLGHLAILFAAAASVYFSWQNTQLHTRENMRRSWIWITRGLFLFLLQQGIHFLNTAFPSTISLVAVSACLYAGGSLLLWIGMFLYPFKLRTMLGRPRLMLELTLTITALITIFWLALIKPLFPSFLSLGVFYGLPVFLDVLTIVILLSMFVLSETKQEYPHLSWMLFGFIAFLFSNMGYLSLLSSQQDYHAGNPVDIGWVVGYLILVAVLQRQTSPRTAHNGFWGRIVIRIQSLLPIVTVIVLGWFSLLSWQITGVLENLGLWTTLVLGLGLFLRQGIVAGEIALEQYARLVNSIAEPAFICDQNGILKMVNPALLTVGNFDSQDVLGDSLEKLIDFNEEERSRWKQVCHHKPGQLFEGVDMEVFLKTKSGYRIPVMLSLRPIQSGSGQMLSMAGTAHDLRLQKLQQSEIQAAYEEVAQARAALERLNAGLEQLVNEKTADLQSAYAQLEEQNKQLQQLDQIKSDFVSLVSHELRAPLTNIRGGIELLLSGYINDPQRIHQNLTQVQAEILRLSQFTETILDLSALDANRLPLYPEPLNLSAVVSDLQKYYQNSPDQQRFVWELPADLPPILADRKALHSILFHILDNATKYAPLGQITIAANQDEESLQISITDEGKGIPEEVQPFLFDRFYRASMADAQTVYGHGLGLYLVRRFTEAMQGEVRVHNTEQGGACFVIKLPLVC